MSFKNRRYTPYGDKMSPGLTVACSAPLAIFVIFGWGVFFKYVNFFNGSVVFMFVVLIAATLDLLGVFDSKRYKEHMRKKGNDKN